MSCPGRAPWQVPHATDSLVSLSTTWLARILSFFKKIIGGELAGGSHSSCPTAVCSGTATTVQIFVKTPRERPSLARPNPQIQQEMYGPRSRMRRGFLLVSRDPSGRQTTRRAASAHTVQGSPLFSPSWDFVLLLGKGRSLTHSREERARERRAGAVLRYCGADERADRSPSWRVPFG